MVGCRDAVLKIWSNLAINVVIIWDQDTGWVCGEMIIKEEKRSLAAHISTFILRTFTSYGFVNLELSGFTLSLFQAVNTYFREVYGLLCNGVPELQGTESGLLFSADDLTTPLDEEMEKLVAKDLDEAVEDLTIRASLSDLEVILAASRFRREHGSSPFQNIFGWDGREKVCEERRVLKSALLHCKHCHLSFTSKISFRIHQRIHLKASRRRGELEGQLKSELKLESGEENEDIFPKNRKRTRKAKLKQERLDLLASKLSKHKEIVSRTEKEEAKGELLADTVHTLLRVTSAERARRGHYINVSQESRDEIAEFALQHGFQAAANHFSSTHNQEVSISAIRGIVKMYQLYRPELRKQMGEYAELHGLDVAAKYYSQLLGREVRRSTIKRFRSQFGRRRAELEAAGGREGKIDSTALRQEIGRYAAEHSVEAAVSVYSQKLQTSLKPVTVRKLRRLYGNNVPVSSDTSTTIDLLHSSINVLNQSGAGYYTIPYAALPLDQHQEVNLDDGEEMVTLHAVDGNQLQGEVVNLQHSAGRLVESLNGGIFSASDGSSTATTSHFVEQQDDVIVAMVQVDSEEGRSQDLSLKLEANDEFIKSANTENNREKELKSTKFERGRYVQYTSQERAEIGAFAAKHGNKAAILHFEEKLGRSIPESTIRVMKDKYKALVRMSGGQISEVGCGSRGRPTCLGKHDQTLMDTLHRLIKRGEKMTTFAVIATAKQILSEREVDRDWQMATETKLTPNWAKSILKRINKQK